MSRWDKTPVVNSGKSTETVSRWGKPNENTSQSEWDKEDKPKPTSSRWDTTPQTISSSSSSQSSSSNSNNLMNRLIPNTGIGMFGTPSATPLYDAGQGMGLQTPGPLTQQQLAIEQAARTRWEREMDERNKPLTDEELDAMLPQTGYKILPPPSDYVPLMTPARRLMSTPQVPGSIAGSSSSVVGDQYIMPQSSEGLQIEVASDFEGIPIQPEEKHLFALLLKPINDESELSPQEQKERQVQANLLRIKNGDPQQRHLGLKMMSEKAREYGADIIFNTLVSLIHDGKLDGQERHLLIKVLDRTIFRLSDDVRPYVHKILDVTEPMLMDEDFYARIEGKQIIANLAKAAGLPTMIAAIRPDIDSTAEDKRNSTSRAFAVVAVALGVPASLPFLRAVCKSKRSHFARHTGIKMVQQIAILLGCGVLPYLTQLVDTIKHGLFDQLNLVRTITALALASLAEASAPYGLGAFVSVLPPLVNGINKSTGKLLSAYFKCIGCLFPLMNKSYAEGVANKIKDRLLQEFSSPDTDIKKIILRVVQQMITAEGVSAEFIQNEILQKYIKSFWNNRIISDNGGRRQLVETTLGMANKIGPQPVLSYIVVYLKSEAETERVVAAETIDKIVTRNGLKQVDDNLEKVLVDSILFALQNVTSNNSSSSSSSSSSSYRSRRSPSVILLNCFGTIVDALGSHFSGYISSIITLIYHRINSKDAYIRQQASDMVTKIANAISACGQDELLLQTSEALNESLGEEFPEVLGSIIGALKAIVNVIGMKRMRPSISDLLPRLTPILRNRHEKVAENCIDLVGRIAERGPEYASPREWMRICFELLDVLKSPKRGIRRAATNTFGYIARAVDPQEVLGALLQNLRVQERTNRVCTTVAIAIVAEQCGPFTILPFLMNEYRQPELNVQNGVLKSLSFMFEHIGEMSKDYVYSLTTLLENALIDRDQVHRQTAAAALKHLALGVTGLGKEDAITHLFNCLWPNIFETSAHVIQAVLDAIDGCRVCLGGYRILQYTLQGLWHPARKVRNSYWRIFNITYIGNQDALVPYYPRLDFDSNNNYAISHLDLLI